MDQSISNSVCSVLSVVPPEKQVISVRCAGHQFDLRAQRAIHWKKRQTLIIADAHFGKAAAYRAAGVPVPEATTNNNLERLSKLLAETKAARLIVLGDFLHAAAGRVHETMAAIDQWRREHRELCITLVRGNHDHHAGDPPTEWNITCADEPFIENGFEFRHTPSAACGLARPAFTFAGHVHPCAILHDRDGSSLRAACFHLTQNQMILPAFGAFTGMHPIEVRKGDRVFAVGPASIIEVKSKAAWRTSGRKKKRRVVSALGMR